MGSGFFNELAPLLVKFLPLSLELCGCAAGSSFILCEYLEVLSFVNGEYARRRFSKVEKINGQAINKYKSPHTVYDIPVDSPHSRIGTQGWVVSRCLPLRFYRVTRYLGSET
jgi:hypothetical protein